MEYDNTNRGTLGKNKNPKSDDSPEYTGKLNVNGVDYNLNGWIRTNKKDNSKFFGLSIMPKEESQKPKEEAQKPVAAAGFADLDSDIPF
jgi:hypothetical protein